MVTAGFHYNVVGQTGPIDWRSEVLNEAAKSALGLAYLMGALGTNNKHLVEVVDHREHGAAISRHLKLRSVASGRNGREGSTGWGRVPSWVWGGRCPWRASGGVDSLDRLPGDKTVPRAHAVL
jgi:hypothetical protein